MKVEIEDVLFWMDAIRNSDDRYRTLESFWKGQVRSKIWLIENLADLAGPKPSDIVIHGGWNGVLASLLFNSHIPINTITSVDIDPGCREIACTINKRYEMSGKFFAVTDDMKTYTYSKNPDIVINTSCEHVCDNVLSEWRANIPCGALVAAQSNNYTDLDEHVNCVNSLQQLADKLSLTVKKQDSLDTKKYTRYMIIGYG